MAKLKELTLSTKMTLQETRGHFLGVEVSCTYDVGEKDNEDIIQQKFNEVLKDLNEAIDKSVTNFNFKPSTKGGK